MSRQRGPAILIFEGGSLTCRRKAAGEILILSVQTAARPAVEQAV